MKRLILLLIVISTVLWSVVAAPVHITGEHRIYDQGERNARVAYLSDSVSGQERFDAVLAEMGMLLEKAAYLDIIDIGGAAYRLAERVKDEKLLMYTASFLGQAYTAVNEPDSLRYYLDTALEYGIRLRDHLITARVYNAYGIYAVVVNLDYVNALKYLHMALDEAEKGPKEYFYPMVLGNLAMVYYYRNDAAGLKYAQEAYEIGKRDNDKYIFFAGAFTSANMYYILGEYDEALRYIEESLPYAEENTTGSAVNTLYGDILLELGRTREAKEHYDRAMRHMGNAQLGEALNTYLHVGEYHLRVNEPRKAIAVLQEGIRFAKEKNVSVHRYKVYQALSRAYQAIGETEKALEYYVIYHMESDSMFNVERERSVNELRIAYEAEKREKEIQEKELQIAREQKRSDSIMLVSAFVVVLVTLGGTAVYFSYRRKNRMYMQMVRQYHDFSTKEKTVGEIPSAPASGADEPKYSLSSLTDEKGKELFMHLEDKMCREHLYRDNTLTVEKLAEIMGTNRTYLSQVINDHSGDSFYNYIYSYRVDEAVQVLTGPDGDRPLKMIAADTGFSSLNTFYVKFRDKMGMPPSKFRENWKKLYKGEA